MNTLQLFLGGAVLWCVGCAPIPFAEGKGSTTSKQLAPVATMHTAASSRTTEAFGIVQWKLYRGKKGLVLTGYDEDDKAVKGLSVDFVGTKKEPEIRARVHDGKRHAERYSFKKDEVRENKTMTSSSNKFQLQAMSDMGGLSRFIAKKARAGEINSGNQCSAAMMSIMMNALTCMQNKGNSQSAKAQCTASAKMASQSIPICQNVGTTNPAPPPPAATPSGGGGGAKPSGGGGGSKGGGGGSKGGGDKDKDKDKEEKDPTKDPNADPTKDPNADPTKDQEKAPTDTTPSTDPNTVGNDPFTPTFNPQTDTVPSLDQNGNPTPAGTPSDGSPPGTSGVSGTPSTPATAGDGKVMTASADSDQISGSAGNDQLGGSAGSDTLSGFDPNSALAQDGSCAACGSSSANDITANANDGSVSFDQNGNGNTDPMGGGNFDVADSGGGFDEGGGGGDESGGGGGDD